MKSIPFILLAILRFTAPLFGQDNAEIWKLIGQLGSDSAETREAVARQLLDMGEKALPTLDGATTSIADPGIRRRCRELPGPPGETLSMSAPSRPPFRCAGATPWDRMRGRD